MYIGTQGTFAEDHDLEMLAQLGVNNIDTTPSEPITEWTTDLLTSYRERCAKFGIKLEMMHFIGSGCALNDKNTGAIFLKPSDERERQLVELGEAIVIHAVEKARTEPCPGDGRYRHTQDERSELKEPKASESE